MKDKPRKKYPLVAVEWADAQSDCEWGSQEKINNWIEKDCIINEIGWLVAENDNYIVITNQIGRDDGEFGNRTKIPVQWVKSRKVLGKKL